MFSTATPEEPPQINTMPYLVVICNSYIVIWVKVTYCLYKVLEVLCLKVVGVSWLKNYFRHGILRCEAQLYPDCKRNPKSG
jgi:hypothetical protein